MRARQATSTRTRASPIGRAARGDGVANRVTGERSVVLAGTPPGLDQSQASFSSTEPRAERPPRAAAARLGSGRATEVWRNGLVVSVVAALAVLGAFVLLPRVAAAPPRRRRRSPVGLRAIAGASPSALAPAPASTTPAGIDGFEMVE